MKPVKFDEANKVLVHPSSMTEEQCSDLHVYRDESGQLISCWELSGEELMEVLKTKRVWLFVWGGNTQPPVAIDGISPFKEVSDETTEKEDRQGDGDAA